MLRPYSSYAILSRYGRPERNESRSYRERRYCPLMPKPYSVLCPRRVQLREQVGQVVGMLFFLRQ